MKAVYLFRILAV